MTRKIARIALMTALLLSLVGLGVHILHKEARADDVTYFLYIYDPTTQEPVADLEDVWIWVSVVNEDDIFERMMPSVLGDGWYEYEVIDMTYTSMPWWQIELNDVNVELLVPDDPMSGELPMTQTSFEWHVIDLR